MRDKYFRTQLYLAPLLHVQNSQWLNWKINSNLNDWNKELLESEIKRLSSPRSPLIGKSFLQGILMVLKEDCKAKLMSWRRVNSYCMSFCVSAWLYVQRVCMLCSWTQGFLLTNGQNEEKSLDQDTSWWLCSHHTGRLCSEGQYFHPINQNKHASWNHFHVINVTLEPLDCNCQTQKSTSKYSICRLLHR